MQAVSNQSQFVEIQHLGRRRTTGETGIAVESAASPHRHTQGSAATTNLTKQRTKKCPAGVFSRCFQYHSFWTWTCPVGLTPKFCHRVDFTVPPIPHSLLHAASDLQRSNRGHSPSQTSQYHYLQSMTGIERQLFRLNCLAGYTGVLRVHIKDITFLEIFVSMFLSSVIS